MQMRQKKQKIDILLQTFYCFNTFQELSWIYSSEMVWWWRQMLWSYSQKCEQAAWPACIFCGELPILIEAVDSEDSLKQGSVISSSKSLNRFMSLSREAISSDDFLSAETWFL